MAVLKPLGYYPWHWQEYRADRRVQRLSWEAKGVYRELLDECWAVGSIDPRDLEEITGCAEAIVRALWEELTEAKLFAKQANGSFISPDLEELRTEKDALRIKRQAIGKQGGDAKYNNANPVLPIANQLLTNCHIEEKRREEKEEKETTTMITASPSAPLPVAPSPKRKRNKNFDIAATMLPEDVQSAFTRCWENWPTQGYNFKEKSNQPRRINQAKAAENFWLICQNLNLSLEDGTVIGPDHITEAALAWVDRLRDATRKKYGQGIAPPVPCIANFFSADPASKKHWQEAIVEHFGV